MSSKEICVERTTCRICQSSELLPVIDLGEQYVASIFVKDGIPDSLQRRYPLELVRCCGNNGCGLVQLRHSLPPSMLYSDYGYRSGMNQSMRDNLLDIATKAEQMVELKVSGKSAVQIFNRKEERWQPLALRDGMMIVTISPGGGELLRFEK